MPMSIIEKALDKLVKNDKSALGRLNHDLDVSDMISDDNLINDDTKEIMDSNLPKFQKGQDNSGKSKNGFNKKSETVTIDLAFLDTAGFITPDTKNHQLFEQYRHLKMQILSHAFANKTPDGNNSNLVIVTSAVSGEGKTFTSLNLALSVAYEYNNTVLFMDGDTYKQTSSKLLNIYEKEGLTDYLMDANKNLTDVLFSTNIEKFTVIPSGKSHARTTELFNSKRMQFLMHELSRRYNDRLIIIDTPPLLEDTSTSAIASHADQVILVIEAEKTPKHIVEEALRRLEGDKHIGVILNKSNQRYGGEYGYYSYGA